MELWRELVLNQRGVNYFRHGIIGNGTGRRLNIGNQVRDIWLTRFRDAEFGSRSRWLCAWWRTVRRDHRAS